MSTARRNARRRSRYRRGGFTFLELIMATALMSVLALTLYGSLRIAFKARDTALNAVGPSRAAEMAMAILRRDVESALAPTGVLAGSFIGQYGAEVAGTSEVEFFAIRGASPAVRELQDATAPGGAGRGGAARAAGTSADPTAFGGTCKVALLVRPAPTDGVPTLVRRVTRNLLAPAELEPEEEIICRGVRAFTIRYFDGYEWIDAWDSTQQGDSLPMAVEITLEVDAPATNSNATAPAPGTAAAAGYRTTRIFQLACFDLSALQGGGA